MSRHQLTALLDTGEMVSGEMTRQPQTQLAASSLLLYPAVIGREIISRSQHEGRMQPEQSPAGTLPY